MKKISAFSVGIISILLILAAGFTCSAASVGDVPAIRTASRENYVVLAWDKAEDAQGYGVFLYDTAFRKWNAKAVVAGTYYKAEQLEPGKNYIFAVRAYVKDKGRVQWSPSLKRVTASTRPECIKQVKSVSGQTAVTLSWEKAEGATGYRVFRYNTATKKWDIEVKATAKQQVTVKNLKQGKNYIFSVRPYFNTGKAILWSTAHTQVFMSTLPTKVIGVRINSSTDSATIKWNAASGATRYYVYMYDSAARAYKVIGSTEKITYTVNNLEINRNYYFLVRAVRSVNYQGKTTHYWGACSDKIKVNTAADMSLWGPAYQDILEQHYPENNNEFNYWILDINNDSIPELFVRKGVCYADEYVKIYTIKDKSIQLLGTIAGGHIAAIAPTTSGNGFYLEYIQMGYEMVLFYTYEAVEKSDYPENAKGKTVYEANLNDGIKRINLVPATSCHHTDISGLFWLGNPKNNNDKVIEKGEGLFYGF